MNVCLISGFANYSGGLENVVDQLDFYLKSKRVDVTVYAEKKPNYLPKQLWSFYHRRSSYHKLIYSLESWHNIQTQKFDVIHGHGDNCFFPALLHSKSHIPLIMSFHGTAIKSISTHDPRTLPSVYAEKVAASNCDVAVACSQAVAKELKDYYGVSRVQVIYNGVDTDMFVPRNKIQARDKLNLPYNKQYALWVGHDPIRKGLQTATKELQVFPNIHLLVAGLNVPNSKGIICLGHTSIETLIDAYNAADFLFLPTLYEGFPLVPMEALSCGLPILVSKESNMVEIMKQGKHGFVVNDGSYKDKIEILQDPIVRSAMSNNCRELALEYNWKKQAEKYLLLYQHLT
jgi:glycosyltransferase involved in cell wall biosynthesis